MIAEAEIRRRARAWSVDPMVVELDYVLGCFIQTWFRQPASAETVFKGGTCLRKCYFPDYRFSEDVDLSARGPLDPRLVADALETVSQHLERDAGLNLRARPTRIQTVGDDPSTTYLEARLYFTGPLRRTGWPQAIRIDIVGGEWLAFQPVARELIHPYSDAGAMGLPGLSIPCYDLREVLLEKLRGLAGQRRFAIARDLYDVHHLLQQGGLDVQQVLPFARDKFAARNVGLSGTVLEALRAREDEYRSDWSRNVEKLVPSEGRSDFEDAWTSTMRAMATLVHAAAGGEQ